VTPDRVSLGQDTVCAIRLVSEFMVMDMQVSGIPVTHRMLQLARIRITWIKREQK